MALLPHRPRTLTHTAACSPGPLTHHPAPEASRPALTPPSSPCSSPRGSPHHNQHQGPTLEKLLSLPAVLCSSPGCGRPAASAACEQQECPVPHRIPSGRRQQRSSSTPSGPFPVVLLGMAAPQPQQGARSQQTEGQAQPWGNAGSSPVNSTGGPKL